MSSSESIHNKAAVDEEKHRQSRPLSPSDTAETDGEALERVSTPLTPPAPVMDGGMRAWLQVLGSFLVFGNLWGMTFAFGSFQTYYEIDYLPDESPSSISWIGTVSTFLLVVVGVVSGPLFDMGYFRTMLFVGAFLETLGVFLTSLCTQYYQLFLAQGVLMGLGNGFLYVPGLALVGRSFNTHRSIAMAITTCGAPVGGVIYTLVFEQLIGGMSFGSTVRIQGYVMLGSYGIAFPLLLWGASNIGDLGSGEKRKLIDVGAFRDLPFCAYTFSNFFIFLGYMVPFIYLASYGQTALGMGRSFALYVIMIAQASSIIGRLGAGYAASKIGVMTPWSFCAISSGIFCVAWAGVSNVGGFITVAALYGCFSGALIPLPPSVFPIVCPDPKVLGAQLGMAQGIGSIASLIGGPIAGALTEIDARRSRGGVNYLGMQLFSGLVMIFGGLNLINLWRMLVKRRNTGKRI